MGYTVRGHKELDITKLRTRRRTMDEKDAGVTQRMESRIPGTKTLGQKMQIHWNGWKMPFSSPLHILSSLCLNLRYVHLTWHLFLFTLSPPSLSLSPSLSHCVSIKILFSFTWENFSSHIRENNSQQLQTYALSDLKWRKTSLPPPIRRFHAMSPTSLDAMCPPFGWVTVMWWQRV